MKIVLTGGPCSGKSSVIKDLERRNYRVVHEAAREIIMENPGITFEELEKRVFAKQLEMEAKLDGKLTFLDRGLIDVLAYCSVFTGKISEVYEKFDFSNRYDAIFILDRLPFMKDDVRYETPQEAELLHRRIGEIYSRKGYNPIRVPVMPIEKRTDFVLGAIHAH